MTMLTAAPDMTLIDMSISDAALTACLGYSVVFVGLVLLMVVVMILGKAMVSSESRNKNAEPAVSVASVSVAAPNLATGSAGEINLFDVADKDAAMIMAIVANKMNKPLNELRFKSIKEVK